MADGGGISRFLPDLSAALLRFPVPAAVSALFCLYLNVDAWDSSSSPDDDIVFAAVAAFIGAGAGHLFAEGRGLPRGAGLILAAGAALAFGALGFFNKTLATSPLLLLAGLLLVLMVAPYLHAGARQGALWLFNLRLGLAALLASIVAAAFAAGLSAVVEALNFLFGAGMPDDLHEHIWMTAASLVAPVYGLSLMPRDLDEEVAIAGDQDALLERGVSVLVNYVLVPIALIYAAILHAYAAKILLQWELPEGQIGTMVTIFALGGTAAWLIAWPWRETGTRLLRLYMSGWFWLTIVPAILLVIAVWRRIADYGVTPERYGLALVAVWLAGLAAYLAYRRNRADMRAILGGLAFLLLTSAFGPWGAHGVTVESQFARLSGLLAASGIVKDGKAVQPPPSLRHDQAAEANSMLEALREAGGLARLEPWFEAAAKKPFAESAQDWTLVNNIAIALGLNTTTTPPNSVSFAANAPLDRDLQGQNRLIGPLRPSHNDGKPQADMTALLDPFQHRFTIRIGEETWNIAVADFLAACKGGIVAAGLPQPPVVFEAGPEIMLIVEQANGEAGDKPMLNSASFWVLLKPPTDP